MKSLITLIYPYLPLSTLKRLVSTTLKVMVGLIVALLFLTTAKTTHAQVAYDAESESHIGTTGSTSEASFSWSNVGGTPAGAVVFVFTLNSTTAYDTSVTYGGTGMSLVSGGAATDTAGEPAVVRSYFLGASVPTGSQLVVVNRTNNSTEMYAIAFTVTAGADTEVYTSGIVLLQDNGAWVEQSVDDGSTGVNSLRFVGGYAGTNGMPGSGSSSTAGPTIDFGVYNAGSVYETTAGQGSRSVGFNAGGNDDRAAVHLAVREVVAIYNFSGNIYDADESTAYLCNTTGNLTVNLRVDGSGSDSATCTADSGAWSITGVTVTSGQTIYVYLSGGSVRGNSVLVSDATTQSDVDIFTDRVILRDDVNGSITDSEILAGNTADADDLITTSGTDVVVGSSYETHIYTSDTFAPGDNVETGFLHVDTSSDFTPSSNTLTLTGTSGTLIDRDGTFTQGTSTVTVTSASGTPTLLTAATTFHILTINSSATVINDGAVVTINNAASAALTVTSGVLNFSTTPTGPGGSNGTLTVGSGTTLCLGGAASNTAATCDSTNTVTTAVTMPTFQTYTLNSAGTVRYLSDAATTVSNTPTYGNLVFNPKFDTTSRIYTLGGAMNIDGDFEINPDETGAGSPALTVNSGGTITVASGKTTTIQATNSATSSLDVDPGTSYDLSTGLLDIGSGGTLDGTSATSTITLTATAGTLFTRVGTFTAGSTTVSVTSASGTLTFNSGVLTGSNTLYNLTINPTNLTITTAADDITVTNTLNVSTGDTLSLFSGQVLTHSGTTLTLDGTISGAGNYYYTGGGSFPTTGTFSSDLRLDASSGDINVPDRGANGYGADLELYSNSGTARVFTLATAGSQTVDIVGNLTLTAAGANTVSVTGATYNPTVVVDGNISYTAAGSAESITTGTGTWTVGGNVDFSNGTFTATATNTFIMTGTVNLTNNGQTFQNFEVQTNTVTNVDSMDVDGTFTVTSGGFTHGAGADIDINVAGNFTLQSGTTWTENVTATSQLIFDGDIVFDDNTAGIQSMGNVVIGTSPDTTYLSSDTSANSLTVTSADFYYTCGWEVDIGNGNIQIDGTFDATRTAGGCSSSDADQSTINDGSNFTISATGSFTADQSTLIMDNPSGTDAITLDGESLYNLTASPGGTTQFADTIDIDNDLSITTGTLDMNGQTVTIGGGFDNDAALTHGNAPVTFNAASGTKTIDADETTDAFYSVDFNDSGGGATWQLTTLMDVDNNFTISNGTFDGNGQTINIGNNYSNSGVYTAGTNGKVIMDAQDAGNTLGGTMTGSSSFYDLEFDDSATTGAWSFGANSATVTHDFIITGGAVTAPASGQTLTISEDFTNSDSFTHNSGTVVFNGSNDSNVLYTATTTFSALTISTAGKQMYFEDSDGVVTDIDGLFTVQGTNCTTGRVFLDGNSSLEWEINVSDGSTNIDYADVEDSKANGTTIVAEESTEDNGGNTNWTVNAGACVTQNTRVRSGVRGFSGVRIK